MYNPQHENVLILTVLIPGAAGEPGVLRSPQVIFYQKTTIIANQKLWRVIRSFNYNNNIP